jgi:hypothetical protein
LGRAPGWLGAAVADGAAVVAVEGWVVVLAAGCPDASDGPSMQTLSTRLNTRENKPLRGSGRLRRNGVLSLFHDLSVKEKGRLFA